MRLKRGPVYEEQIVAPYLLDVVVDLLQCLMQRLEWRSAQLELAPRF